MLSFWKKGNTMPKYAARDYLPETTPLFRIRNRMLDRLGEAQQFRKKRDDWVEFEQKEMLKAVNDERRKLGKPALPLEAVQNVEKQALGHSDYSSKFALYCAELALQ